MDDIQKKDKNKKKPMLSKPMDGAMADDVSSVAKKKPDKTMDEKKKLTIIAVVVAVVVVIVVLLAIWFWPSKPAEVLTTPDGEEITVAGDASLLTGEPAGAEVIGRVPAAVMIENLASIRDLHAGYQSADIVYEALVEAGITRTMAVFQSGSAERVGPVRSARDYYLDWAAELDAAYYHVGGSPLALALLKANNMKDVDQFFNSSYFDRDGSIGAPHNVFTDTKRLYQSTSDKGWQDKGWVAQPWSFKDDSGTDGTTTDIIIHFSSSAYDVEWTYDAENNWYTRKNGGEVHKDVNTGEAIHTRNVIVQVVPSGVVVGDDKGRISLNTIGEGKVLVFSEGNVSEGTWVKPKKTSRTRFVGADGQDIQLVKGNSWIEVISPDQTVEY